MNLINKRSIGYRTDSHHDLFVVSRTVDPFWNGMMDIRAFPDGVWERVLLGVDDYVSEIIHRIVKRGINQELQQ